MKSMPRSVKPASQFFLMLIFFISMHAASLQSQSSAGTMTGNDGKVYKTVRIGKQIWMAENLRETKYRNGKEIPAVTDDSEWADLRTGARCFYENKVLNALSYGYLYNWFAVADRGNIAPRGWRVPTDEDWKILEKYLGMNEAEVEKWGWRGNEGGKLKDTGTAHWGSPNEDATNESGFSALPGGYRYGQSVKRGRGAREGYFGHLGYYAAFWSSSEFSFMYAWSRFLDYRSAEISHSNSEGKEYGLSVRLIKE